MRKEHPIGQTSRLRRYGAPVLLALAALSLPILATLPAAANRFGGGGNGSGDRSNLEDPRNRTTVSIVTVPVGAFCVRAVEAVGYDPRLNQRLYRVRFNSGAMASLGVTAYENALAFARTEQDALRGLEYARADAAPYVRDPSTCR
jgi:hypothetical protein